MIRILHDQFIVSVQPFRLNLKLCPHINVDRVAMMAYSVNLQSFPACPIVEERGCILDGYFQVIIQTPRSWTIVGTVPRSLHMANIRCLVAATTLFDLFFVSSQLSIFSSGSQKYVCGCSTPPLLYTIFKYIVEFVFSMNMHETLGTVRKTSDNQSVTHCDDMLHKHGYSVDVSLFAYFIQFVPNLTSQFYEQ